MALKRKEQPGGSSSTKSTKTTADRPSKRPRSERRENESAGTTSKSASKLSTSPAAPRPREEEPLFPRGGGCVLTPLEYKQIQLQAKNDALFEQESGAPGREEKTIQKRRKPGVQTKPVRDEDDVKIESLNFKRLVKGSLVLGTICAINALEMVLALPNNLVGHIAITAVSQTLTDRLQAIMRPDGEDDVDEDSSEADKDGQDAGLDLQSLFYMGQYLRAYVVSTTPESAGPSAKTKRHVELSLQPVDANAGLTEQGVVEHCTVMASVASVEDHGFVMELAISGSKMRGFLAKKQLDRNTPEERMQPGAVLLCIVTGKSANGQVVQLSALSDRLCSVKHHPSSTSTVDSYQPGTAAELTISHVSSYGIAGKVMGLLDLTADLVHSGAGPDGVDLGDKYKVGDKVKARVICSFPTASKPVLGVSLRPHVLSMKTKVAGKRGQQKAPLDVLANSALVEECRVVRVEREVGLYVDVGLEGFKGFVHISRVQDGKVGALFANSGPYKLGSVHAGRVVGYNALDGLFLLSLEQSVLEQAFLRVEDVPLGAVVAGRVERLVTREEGVVGMIVEIARGISGLVPRIHLADLPLQDPERKYREGMKVQARVLSTDPARHQLRLTLKKTLVNSDCKPLSRYDELAVGMRSPGTIIKLVEHGAIVQFYGQLRAFLPISEMSDAYVHHPNEHFRDGQVCTFFVKSWDADAKRLVVSCKDPAAFGAEKQLALGALKPGDIVSATVTQKTEDGILLELADSSLKAILPAGHVTDKSVSKTRSAWKRIHVGQVLSDLVVLEKDEGRRSITLSHKPSLVQASRDGKLLCSADDAQVGAEVPAFVRNLTATAAFVQFAGSLTALLPASLIPPDARQKEDFGLRKYQSVTVKIKSVDRELGRLVVAIASPAHEARNKAAKVDRPLDGAIPSITHRSLGTLTKAKIVSVRDTHLHVKLTDKMQGRIDVSQIYDSWDTIPDRKHPLKQFHANQILPVRVLGVREARKDRLLPISSRTSSVVELSTRPSDTREGASPTVLSLESLELGSTHLGFVTNFTGAHVWVNLSANVCGKISFLELSDELRQMNELEQEFPKGSAIRVRVVAVDTENGRLDLSARSSVSAAEAITWDKIQEGMVLPGRITKVNEWHVMVQLKESIAGPVQLTDMVDDYDQAVTAAFSKNDLIRVAVVEVDKVNKKLRLSTRPSRVLNSALPVKDAEIKQSTELEVGQIVRGFIKNTSDKGVFVNLGGSVVAMVQIRNLSDSYLKDWKKHYRRDQVVKGRISSIADGRITMSLRPSVVEDDYVPTLTLADLKEGQVVTGKVRKVEEYGAFIDLDGSENLSGLCHRSEMAEKPVTDGRTLYKAGDVVKARILRVDSVRKRIGLGLKPSYFDEDDEADEAIDFDKNGTQLLDHEADGEDEDMADAAPVGPVLITSTADLQDDSEGEEAESERVSREGSADEIEGLHAGAFDWSGGQMDVDGSKEEGLKKSARTRAKDSQVQTDRTAMDKNGAQTTDDLERLLLGQPNASQLWIEYMALGLGTGDVAGARAIAERAIRTINIKEETEKVNVWVAYLNLECNYGTDDSLEDVFKRACMYNDDQDMYGRLATIYIQAGKHDKAEKVLEATAKKFGKLSADIWYNYANFLHVTANQPERARALLKRAMQSLGTTSHVKLGLIPKFAALEFRSPNGDRDQGRTLFENLLAAYPKRFDLWNQLLDLELSPHGRGGGKGQCAAQDPAIVRDLFDRCTKVRSLKPHQAKVWFRRWAAWEDENGNARSRERVSAKALEWAGARRASRDGAEGVTSEADHGGRTS